MLSDSENPSAPRTPNHQKLAGGSSLLLSVVKMEMEKSCRDGAMWMG